MSQSLTEIVEDVISSGTARIPVFDQNSAEIRRMVAQGEFDIGELERIIERDPGLAGELLRLANSAFYGGLDKVVTVREAIMRTGAQRCAELATLVAQKQAYQVRDPELSKIAKQLWEHALSVALGSDWLANRLDIREISKHTMLAGLLHDVGKLLVLVVIDDLKTAHGAKFATTDAFIHEAMNALHCHAGEELLRRWEIPEEYTRVVQQHHDDAFDESDLLLLVVRLVDQACNKIGVGIRPQPELSLPTTAEAQALRVPELALAELEVQIEDLASEAAD